jgi:hypothetical protein
MITGSPCIQIPVYASLDEAKTIMNKFIGNIHNALK